MDDLFLFEKLMQALSDATFIQVVDDFGFVVGVSLGCFLILVAGSFLISEAFSAFSGKMHLPFGRVAAGALVVIMAFLAAGALRSAIAGQAGVWGQLAGMVLLLIGVLGFGTWMTMQLDLGRSLMLAPIFAIAMAFPVLVFNFVIWPGTETRLTAARSNLETVDFDRYGFEAMEAEGDEGGAISAVDQLEARMLRSEARVAPSKLAIAVRQHELQEAYQAIKLWSERAAKGNEEQRRDYRQILRRYEEARMQLMRDQASDGSGV